MFDALNQKLEENRQGMDRYQRLGSKLGDYQKQLDELEVKRYNLKQQLTKEEEEYDSLFKKKFKQPCPGFTQQKREKRNQRISGCCYRQIKAG